MLKWAKREKDRERINGEDEKVEIEETNTQVAALLLLQRRPLVAEKCFMAAERLDSVSASVWHDWI